VFELNKRLNIKQTFGASYFCSAYKLFVGGQEVSVTKSLFASFCGFVQKDCKKFNCKAMDKFRAAKDIAELKITLFQYPFTLIKKLLPLRKASKYKKMTIF